MNGDMTVEVFRHEHGWRWRLADVGGSVVGASLRDYPSQAACCDQASVLFPGARLRIIGEGGDAA